MAISKRKSSHNKNAPFIGYLNRNRTVIVFDYDSSWTVIYCAA